MTKRHDEGAVITLDDLYLYVTLALVDVETLKTKVKEKPSHQPNQMYILSMALVTKSRTA